MKKLLYILFFVFAFLVSLYLTFPADALRPFLEKQMQSALAGQAQGVHLVIPPKVHIGELSLWRLSGVSLDDVHIQVGSETLDPGPMLDIQNLKIRMGIFSTLSGHPKIQFDASVYGGRARGDFIMTSKGSLASMWLDIKQMDIQKLRGPLPESALKVAGILNLDLDLKLGPNPAKDGSGNLSIDFKNLSVGPGEFQIPGGMGGMMLPLIKLGAFTGGASFQNGKAKIQDLKLAGGDLETHINASVELSDNILFSPLKGSGWFRLKQEFQKANPKIATLLELSPDIKGAEEADGRIFFTLFGSLMAPTPKWGKGE